jgi:hypothetical protein
MPGTDNRIGLPSGVTPQSAPTSRSSEFSSGIQGSGGATHTMQQMAPSGFQPTGVLNPLPEGNGVSPQTYSANLARNYYSR